MDLPDLPAVPAGTLRHGWTWGLCVDSEDWLTVRGSAYDEPPLAADPAGAGPRPDWAGSATPVLGYVAEVPHEEATGPRQVAYRLLTVAEGCDECGAKPGEYCAGHNCQVTWV